MANLAQTFAKSLRALLDRRQMSARQLALKAGMRPATVGAYLNCDMEPSLTAIEKIADILGVPAIQLLSGSTDVAHTIHDCLDAVRAAALKDHPADYHALAAKVPPHPPERGAADTPAPVESQKPHAKRPKT